MLAGAVMAANRGLGNNGAGIWGASFNQTAELSICRLVVDVGNKPRVELKTLFSIH
jgi:hypothetical protein